MFRTRRRSAERVTASCCGPRWAAPEPVGEGHHDIQRRQEEDEMEEEVAVGHALRLVVNDLLAAFVVVVHHKLLLGWKNSMLADRKRQRARMQSLVATKLSFLLLATVTSR